MTEYLVTRQRVNCGPLQEFWTSDHDEAIRAYDIAVSEGDQFVELFNATNDTQIRWHLQPARHVRH